MQIYKFRNCLLNTSERTVIKDDDCLELTTKTFDVLQYLIENAGKVITKDEILGTVWEGSFVEEGNLPVHISKLRKLLGETRENRFIETVQGAGYRFVAPVAESSEEAWREVLRNRHTSTPFSQFGTKNALNSVAVLPFDDQSHGRENEYLVDGFTESLINGLSHTPGLKVIARSTVFRYKNTQTGVKEICRALGVSKVITGRIRLIDDEIWVGVELIDGTEGTQIWGRQYQSPFSEIVGIQNEIIAIISGQLIASVFRSDSPMPALAENAESYRLYLMGKYLLRKRTADDVHKAIEYFQKSVDHCPNNIHSYVEIVNSYQFLHILDRLSRAETLSMIRSPLTTLGSLNESVDVVQLMYGRLKLTLDWKVDAAHRYVRSALQMNSNLVDAHFLYAEILAVSGHFEAAAQHAVQILTLDPISILSLKQAGRIFYKIGEQTKSISCLNDAFEMEPSDFETLLLLGANHAELKDYSRALAFLTQSYEGHPTIETLSMIGYVEALNGRGDRAREVIKRIRVELKDHQSHPLNLARIYLALGEKSRAYQLLEKAFAQRAVDMYGLHCDPRWKVIRPEKKFMNLIHRVQASPDSI